MSVSAGGTAGPVIALQDAAFGYGERPVVSGVTLSIHPGEVVAVLGPNGSGKSTLVKGILGLADQFAGQVHLFDVPRQEFREHPRLGYVPQRHTLSGTVRATVGEVVATGRLSRQPWYGRYSAADAAHVERALMLVGLADRERVDVADLSGGQQRRVLIARALAGEPEVLVMDEPTAGVDAANQHVLAEVLARLVAEGLTILVVTHELAAFADLVTRVIVVDNGHVQFDGAATDFAARRDDVLHDHDSHHHDDELSAPAQPRQVVPRSVEVPRPGRRHG